MSLLTADMSCLKRSYIKKTRSLALLLEALEIIARTRYLQLFSYRKNDIDDGWALSENCTDS